VVLHRGHLGKRDVGIVEHVPVAADDGDPNSQEPRCPAHELVQLPGVREPRLDVVGEEVDLAAEAVTRAVLDGAIRDAGRDDGQSHRESQCEETEQEVQSESEAHGSPGLHFSSGRSRKR